MAEKRIYFSNISNLDFVMEQMMIACKEQLGMKACVQDFDQEDVIASPIVMMCNCMNIDDVQMQKKMKEVYQANQAVILYEPTNNEVNQMYRTLQGKNYFCAESKGHRHTLFGIKRCLGGITQILECHYKDPESIAEALVEFLKEDTHQETITHRLMLQEAAKALEESETNLATVANQHVITKRFTLGNKNLSLSYYIIAAHKYMEDEDDGGEDWFFIQQHGVLNGKNGYEYKWAGTNQKINGEKYYVGDGEVCLNYVDHYFMQNYIQPAEDESTVEVDLMYAQPEAINNKTTYTIKESVSIGGAVGFEGGIDGGNPKAVGNGSFSMGAGFDSSYSFDVPDCTCEGASLDVQDASAAWKYSFTRAKQNRKAFHWQELHEPALLSRSAFSPWNAWVWKFPTKRRNDYKSFQSLFRIAIMNTISRYSGSQSPKHIYSKFTQDNKTHDYAETCFEVMLHMPPLLGVNTQDILLSKEAQTTSMEIISQGSWTLSKQDAKADWIRMSESSGAGGTCKIKLSVDECSDEKERCVLLRLSKDRGAGTDEYIEIHVMQSAGSVV